MKIILIRLTQADDGPGVLSLPLAGLRDGPEGRGAVLFVLRIVELSAHVDLVVIPGRARHLGVVHGLPVRPIEVIELSVKVVRRFGIRYAPVFHVQAEVLLHGLLDEFSVEGQASMLAILLPSKIGRASCRERV